MTIDRVDVLGPGPVSRVEGDALATAIRSPLPDAKMPRTIGPAAHVVMLMWLTLDTAPRQLAHRLSGTVEGDPLPQTLDTSPIDVGGTAVRMAPPLGGDGWLAANGPDNATHHRRSWLAHNGRALFPERFAIDFLLLRNGEMITGDPAENRSYPGYGAEVYAVADASVVQVTDGLPDNVPANRAPSGLTAATMSGNVVVLDIGERRHVFYSHLQPGSIRVREGDRVRAGQVLGLLGNSGNSNAPHLHFQVSDAPSLLFSDGLPFVFDRFTHDGVTRQDEMPLRDWVVGFAR